MRLLGNLPRGLPFIVSAPAGTGKTTLVQMLRQEFPCVVESVSYTTRAARPHEQEGVHYHFVTNDEFEQMIAANEFLEHVRLYNSYYGTSRIALERQLSQGKHVILVIDTQGAMKLRETLMATYIFIMPPSLDELRKRLLLRQTESQAHIEERLSWVPREIEASRYYDYHIVNDDLEMAYTVLRSIFIAEEHKVIHHVQELQNIEMT